MRIWTLLLLLLASAAFSAAGQITPIAAGSDEMLFYTPTLLEAGLFSKAPANCGTIAKNALVARVPGDSNIHVAFDADTPDAKKLTSVRFDFTGTGKFTRAFSVGLKITMEQGDEFIGIIPAKTFLVPLHGKQIPVVVTGEFQNNREGYAMLLSMVTAVKATCNFAGNSYAMRLISGKGNLYVGNLWSLVAGKEGFARVVTGDTLIVYPGAGKKPVKGFYGQPLQVDGAWYTIDFSPDNTALVASHLTNPTGTIRFAYPSWEAVLMGDTHLLRLTGNGPLTTLPADNYQVLLFRGSPTPGNKAQAAWVTVSNSEKNSTALSVTANNTTRAPVGAGMIAHIAVTQQQREVTFTLEIKDALGNDISAITLADGSEGAEEVPFEVVDAHGKRLYHDVFEHG